MPFGVVSGVCRGMDVLDEVVIVEGEGAVLGDEFGTSHFNQRGHCCVVVWKCVKRSRCRLRWWVGMAQALMYRWGPRASRGRGCFWDFSTFASPLVWMSRMTYCSPINVFDSCVKSWQYFHTDKIFLDSLFYWPYSQVQDRSGGWGEMYKNVTLNTRKMDLPQHAVPRWRHGVGNHRLVGLH